MTISVGRIARRRCEHALGLLRGVRFSVRARSMAVAWRPDQAQAPFPVVCDQVEGKVKCVAAYPSAQHAAEPHLFQPGEGMIHEGTHSSHRLVELFLANRQFRLAAVTFVADPALHAARLHPRLALLAAIGGVGVDRLRLFFRQLVDELAVMAAPRR